METESCVCAWLKLFASPSRKSASPTPLLPPDRNVDPPIVQHIGGDLIEGDGDGILRLRLVEIVRIPEQEVGKPNAVIASARRSVPVESVCSGCVGEDLLILMRVHPGKAQLEVMRAMDPGQIVLILVAPPGIRPWPVSVVHIYTDRAPTEIDSGDLVDRVGRREERRSSKAGWRVPLVGIGDENIVAILVIRSFVQQAGADLIGGVDNSRPRRNIFER